MVQVFDTKPQALVEAAKVPGSQIHYWQGKYYVTRPGETWTKPKTETPKRRGRVTHTTAPTASQPPSGAVDVSNLSPSKQEKYAAERGYFLRRYGNRTYAVPPSSSHVKDVTDSYALQKAYREAGWNIQSIGDKTYAVWEKGGEAQIPAVVDVTESMAGAKKLKREGYEITSVEGRTFAVHPRAGVTTEDLREAVREAKAEASEQVMRQIARQYEAQKNLLEDLQRRGLIRYAEGKRIGEFEVELAKPIDQLTDEEIDLLSKIGFKGWYLKTQRSLIGVRKTLQKSTLQLMKKYQKEGLINYKFDPKKGEYTVTVAKPFLDLTDTDLVKLGLLGFSTEKIRRKRREIMRKYGWKGSWDEFRIRVIQETPKREVLDRLVKMGLVKEEDGVYVLTRSPEVMTEEQASLARQAGFDIPILPSGPSWRLYQALTEKVERLKSFVPSWFLPPEYKGKAEEKRAALTATVIEGLTSAITSPYQFLASLIPGKQPFEEGYKRITPQTARQLLKLSEGEENVLTLGYTLGSLLGSYAVSVPIGAGVSVANSAAAGIASKLGLTAPSAVRSIASTLAKHPKLLQAALWAPVVGEESHHVYQRYKAGASPDQILREMAPRIAYFIGTYYGLKHGYELPSKIRGWWATRGKTKIPPEELWREYTREFRRLPTYKSLTPEERLKEFKELASQLNAEKYLGKVPKGKYRVWHGTPDPWGYRVGEVTEAGTGHITRYRELPGVYFAPEPSPLRLAPPAGETVSRMGLPRVGGVPEIVSVDALVRQMPKGLSRSQLISWLRKRIGDGVVYVPGSTPFLTSEMEAILPAGSKLMKLSDAFWTELGGRRILVSQYKLLLPGKELQQALAKGYKLYSITDLPRASFYGGLIYPTSAIPPISSSPSVAEMLKIGFTPYDIYKIEIAGFTPRIVSKLVKSGFTPVAISRLASVAYNLPSLDPSELSKLSKKKIFKLMSEPTRDVVKEAPEYIVRRLVEKEPRSLPNVISYFSPKEVGRIFPKMKETIMEKAGRSVLGDVVRRLTPPQLIEVIRQSDTPTIEKLIIPNITPEQIRGIDEEELSKLPLRKRKLLYSIIAKTPKAEKPAAFKVTFRFTVGGEMFKVRAKGFPEALRRAWRLKRTEIVPRVVVVKREA